MTIQLNEPNDLESVKKQYWEVARRLEKAECALRDQNTRFAYESEEFYGKVNKAEVTCIGFEHIIAEVTRGIRQARIVLDLEGLVDYGETLKQSVSAMQEEMNRYEEALRNAALILCGDQLVKSHLVDTLTEIQEILKKVEEEKPRKKKPTGFAGMMFGDTLE